jgi:hypothetical protein
MVRATVSHIIFKRFLALFQFTFRCYTVIGKQRLISARGTLPDAQVISRVFDLDDLSIASN